jgi:hypothetical protein
MWCTSADHGITKHSWFVVLSLAVVITAALSWTSWSLYNSSENRLESAATLRH